MIGALISPIAKAVGGVVDKLHTSEEERLAARIKLAELEQTGELAKLAHSMSAIVAEAKSADPWTSRARPMFLYVMYCVIAFCFISGVVGMVWPARVALGASNVGAMLGAIPEELWWLFGTGYLGYSGVRSYDKRRAL